MRSYSIASLGFGNMPCMNEHLVSQLLMLRAAFVRAALLFLFAWSYSCAAYDRERIEAKLNKRQRLNYKLFSNIQTDLAPWREKGITREQVERTYCTEFTGGFVDGGFRLQILEGELYVVGELPGYAEFNRHVKLFLLDVARHHKLPDVDIVLSTGDSCHPPGNFNGSAIKCPELGPLLVYGKRLGDRHCVTYPDHTFAGWPVVNLPSWQDLWDLMEGKQQHSWSSRKDKLFFRGAMTGNRAWVANDAAFMNSSYTDVQFAKWTGDPSVPFVSLPEHCDYRYLLHLPGQAYSSRLKNLLLCKSTVVFPRDGNDEFWYHLLEDGINIVSPEALSWDKGASSISKAFEDVRADPQRAEKMAQSGHELVRRALRPESIRRYFAELIKAYAALQKFHPSKHPDAVPFVVSALSPDRTFKQTDRTCLLCQ